MDITALLIISYATNCATSGSFAPGVRQDSAVREQSCFVTQTISANHRAADGTLIRFAITNDWAHFTCSFNAAGQCVQQTPLRLLVTETPVVAIVPKTGFVLFTNYSEILIHATPPPPPMPVIRPMPRPGITPLLNLPIAPLPAQAMQVPGAPMVIPAPPTPLAPLPAKPANP